MPGTPRGRMVAMVILAVAVLALLFVLADLLVSERVGTWSDLVGPPRPAPRQ